MLIALPPPQLIEIGGADAVAFAHAQFSSDVLALANGRWQWSAWLSAQGRVRAFFHLLRDNDEHLRLILRGGSATRMREALTRYVFRSKLQLHVRADMRAYKIEQRADNPAIASLPVDTNIETSGQDTRIALPGHNPGCLWLRDAHAAPIVAEDSEAARNRGALADIDAGLATLDPALEDRLLPLWIGLGDLQATSVSKGCYPGQEVVARLHYKGGNKRWLHRIAFDSGSLPAPGSALGVRGDGDDLARGTIVCSAWTGRGTGAALAVLRATDSGDLSALSSPAVEIRDVQR
ncbi:MAG: YgfZ/GcvT domain-containing protein, partial [Rudaea sp.]